MGYVPNESWNEKSGERKTIVVAALKENKRPVGFAAWPKEPKQKKKKGKP